MEKVLTDFVKALRNSNVRVSPAETLDAMSVIDEVGYDDRELLKRSLSIVLPKTPDEKQKFETCFDDFFTDEIKEQVPVALKELNDIEDVKSIHGRLDVAIDKLTDVSNSIHRMLAVHEEKLARQEEASVELEQQIEKRRSEVLTKIDDLHSRITTNTKEIMINAAAQHAEQNKEIQKIREDLSGRIGVMEKWRHVLIGGSIVVGFLLHKFVKFS